MKYENLIDKKFYYWSVLEFCGKNKNGNAQWKCICKCGKEKIVRAADLKSGHSKSCGCLFRNKNNKNWEGIGEMPGTYFTQIQNAAKIRNISFNITKKQIYEMFLKQNKKCALSDLDIKFNYTARKYTGTASLDRIDNTKGYEIDNIQWVHKDINKMKLNHTTEKFIEYCKLIVKKDLNNG